ncbi:hypothetical protein [Caballeronia grimmiae]|uniref:hypothetical protein n=1 Tax=Caballeronia grimmiae TaxID=1071679 RepID=UPI0038B8012C
MANEDQLTRKKTIAAIIIGLIVLLFFYLTEFLKFEDVKTAYIVVQLLSGASWPSFDKSSDNEWLLIFPIAATICVMLNIVPAIGIIWIFENRLTDRREMMNLASAIKYKDISLEAEIMAKFYGKLSPQDQKTFEDDLKDIFRRADAQWQCDLQKIMGPEGASRVKDIIDNTPVTPI